MRVLVIGGTGGAGREIVRQAAAAGHAVTALARDVKAAAAALPGAKVVAGDVLDPASLATACDGQDAVACALGSGLSLFRRMTLLSEGTKALVGAMADRGVRRLVCITGVGAGDSRGHGGFVYDRLIRPTVLRQVYADKDRQEAVVRASGLGWVIVRPAMLTDGPHTGQYRALTDLTGVHGGKIARADVADFVVRQLADGQFLGQTPFLAYRLRPGAARSRRGRPTRATPESVPERHHTVRYSATCKTIFPRVRPSSDNANACLTSARGSTVAT